MGDTYRAGHLEKALHEMENDEYFIPTVKCENGLNINLDKGAVDLLIAYYKDKDITIDGKTVPKYSLQLEAEEELER